MPALYNTLERLWRAEDNQGRIVGYYQTEAAALAAAGVAEQAPLVEAPAAPLAPLALSDGTPVERSTDPNCPSDVYLDATWQGVKLAAWREGPNDAPYASFTIATSDRYAPTLELGTIGPEGWSTLKRLVLSGMVDEMLALVEGKPTPPAPLASPAPSSAYQAIALILKDRERMPTGAELYELRVKDPVMAFVCARVQDWTLYQLGHGCPVARLADDNRFSEQYEAAREAALVKLQAIGRATGIKTSDSDFDSWVAAWGVLDEGGLLPPRTDPIGDAYRDGYQAGLAAERDEPPTPPAAPAVQLVPCIRDDRRSPRNGEPYGSDYVCGPVFFHIPDEWSPYRLQAYIDGPEGNTEVPVADLEAALDAARALLDDPRYQQARRQYEASAPTKKAA